MTEKPADSPSPSSDKPAALNAPPAPAAKDAPAQGKPTPSGAGSVTSGFAAARKSLMSLHTKIAARARAVAPVLSHSWPTAAALVCAIGVGWAGGAMHASEADPSAAARAAELDARMSQIASELRALRELTTASAASAASARPAKPHGDELKPVLDRLGNLAGAFERVERQDRELVARLGQLTDKVDRLEKASAPVTTASIAAAPKPATADQALPRPDPKYVARPVNATEVQPGDSAAQRRVPGWSVREIVDGLALLENNRGQLIEIEQGETLRELGRIRKFERRGRKWVVLTDKGFIEE